MATHDKVIDLASVRAQRTQEKAANERALTVASWKFKALCFKDKCATYLKQKFTIWRIATKRAAYRTLRLTLLAVLNISLIYAAFFAFVQLYKGFPNLPLFAGLIAACFAIQLAKKGVRRGHDYLLANW